MSFERLRSVLRGTDEPAAARVGRYEIEREIGRGGMAVVYEARDPTLGRRVAIKVLHQGTPERLRQEASAAARLRHPNIVAVHEVGPGYIVMDLIQGRPLDEAAPTMTLAERVRAVEAVARAVAHAHARGVVHRDIKPRNVLVEADGRVVLTDFGLAKLVGTHELTMTGALLGTPHYMAPEQILGRQVGPAADVWALGVTLYELVEGRRPFEGEAVGEVHDRILHGTPRAPAGALGAIAMRALARRPERRYRSAEAFAGDLARWLAGRRLTGLRLRALGARRWAAPGAIAAALAVAGAAAWVGVGPGDRPRDDEAELYLGRARVRFERAAQNRARDPRPDYALAEADLRRARELAPRAPEVHEQLATLRWYQVAYAVDRGLEPGRVCTREAEDAPDAPGSPRIRAGRAWRLFMCGRWLRRRGQAAEADAWLARAEQAIAGDRESLSLRGLVRAFRGRFAESERDFAEARRLGVHRAHYHGEARALAGDHAAAESLLADARGPEALVVRARARLAAGRFAEAASDLERVLAEDPRYEQALRPDLARAARREPAPYADLADARAEGP